MLYFSVFPDIMSLRKTVFNDEWLDPKEFPGFSWLSKINEVTAHCKTCHKDIFLSNMGIKALTSHATSKKHKETLIKEKGKRNLSITAFCSSSTTDTQATTYDVSKQVVQTTVTQADVLNAEILWCLKIASSHYSFRSCSNISDLFKSMFHDSTIASQFSMSYDKVAYFLNFGIYPVFHHDLVSNLSSASVFSISFDESMNDVLQQQQMDIFVKFWDDKLESAVTRYFASVFMGYTKATDMLDKFKSGVRELNMVKCLQLSMDGPNVNWLFLSLYKDGLDEGDPKLIETGSCGLHILNNSFKVGSKATEWNISGLLRCLHLLFKSSCARQADFIFVNGVGCRFPLKYCGHRWLENKPVVERAIAIWPSIVKYVRAVPSNPVLKKHVKTSKAFTLVKTMVSDPLILAKMNFFLSMTIPYQDILTNFQSYNPMLPFLKASMLRLMTILMKRVVPPAIIQAATSNVKLCSIDLDDQKNLKKQSETDVGTGTLLELNKASISSEPTFPQLRHQFYKECQSFVIAAIQKVQEKNPLRYEY